MGAPEPPLYVDFSSLILSKCTVSSDSVALTKFERRSEIARFFSTTYEGISLLGENGASLPGRVAGIRGTPPTRAAFAPKIAGESCFKGNKNPE